MYQVHRILDPKGKGSQREEENINHMPLHTSTSSVLEAS